METVEEFRSEISRWETKQVDVNDQLAAARTAADAATSERERVLLAARAEGDAAAQKQLKAATAKLDAATREANDLETLARQVAGKLDQLRADARQAELRNACLELEQLIGERADVTGRIETTLANLCDALREHKSLSDAMTRIANAHNIAGVNAMTNVNKMRAFVRMKLQGAGMDTRVDVFREVRVGFPGLRAEELARAHRIAASFPYSGNGAAKTNAQEAS